ncbi:hypothetical protein AMTR_s00001p00256880 [Amborella trichopoda]|uniref:Uncharacterized protein n=1 Tax=Amborella trichopoda TaxID=13333 RepID=W1NLP8_AMBTC|nr:hypothetical protein AMTR_s00001p00256880 [Amborella trichopoda]
MEAIYNVRPHMEPKAPQHWHSAALETGDQKIKVNTCATHVAITIRAARRTRAMHTTSHVQVHTPKVHLAGQLKDYLAGPSRLHALTRDCCGHLVHTLCATMRAACTRSPQRNTVPDQRRAGSVPLASTRLRVVTCCGLFSGLPRDQDGSKCT